MNVNLQKRQWIGGTTDRNGTIRRIAGTCFSIQKGQFVHKSEANAK